MSLNIIYADKPLDFGESESCCGWLGSNTIALCKKHQKHIPTIIHELSEISLTKLLEKEEYDMSGVAHDMLEYSQSLGQTPIYYFHYGEKEK